MSKEFDFINEMVLSLQSCNNFLDFFDNLYIKIKDFIPCTRVGIAIILNDSKEIQAIANRSDSEKIFLESGYKVELKNSSLNEIIQSNKARIINDLESYYEKKSNSESTKLILMEGIKSSLTLPLKTGGETIGVIFFSSNIKNIFNESHIDFLQTVATPLAALVEKSRLIMRLKEQNRLLEESFQIKNEFVTQLQKEVTKQTKIIQERNSEFQTLLNVARLVSQTTKIEEIIEKLYPIISKTFDINSLSFNLLSRQKDKLKMIYISDSGLNIERFDIFETIHKSKWFTSLNYSNYSNSQNGLNFVDSDFLSDSSYEELYFFRKNGSHYQTITPLSYQNLSLGVFILGKQKKSVFSQKERGFLAELFDILKIGLYNSINITQLSHDKQRFEEKSSYLSLEIDKDFSEIVGESKPLKNLLDEIKKVAPTNATVLIQGETGAGKELIARAIHQKSSRSKEIFVKINCAALSESLITSELFGHEKGAFTGAIDRKIGKFELADKGTIFLDEIGEISHDVQIKLLRVLQERELERVGGNKTIRVDVRVIAATNKDLKKEVEKNSFRADLYYRLNVFPLYLPPLRERKDDIIPLCKHFVKKYSTIMGKNITEIPEKGIELLLNYPFYGNIRELENLIERSVILSDSNSLTLPFKELISTSKNILKDNIDDGIDFETNNILSLDEVIEKYLKKVMEYTKWKIYGEDGAAKLLNIPPTTLQSKLKKLKIK
ncbi:sigma 54-interacting transcriptional regulator [bacterium]|nr:sigma 54-interacting transcriptional regulator [bacterium]